MLKGTDNGSGCLPLRGALPTGHDQLMLVGMREGRVLVLNETEAVPVTAASWSSQGQGRPQPSGEEALAARCQGRWHACVGVLLPTRPAQEATTAPGSPRVPRCSASLALGSPHHIPSSSVHPCAQWLPRHLPGRLGSPYTGPHLHEQSWPPESLPS